MPRSGIGLNELLGAHQHECPPPEQEYDKKPDHNNDTRRQLAGRSLRCALSLLAGRCHNRFRQQPNRQREAQRYEHDVIQVAEDGTEVRDEINWAERVRSDEQSQHANKGWCSWIASRVVRDKRELLQFLGLVLQRAKNLHAHLTPELTRAAKRHRVE